MCYRAPHPGAMHVDVTTHRAAAEAGQGWGPHSASQSPQDWADTAGPYPYLLLNKWIKCFCGSNTLPRVCSRFHLMTQWMSSTIFILPHPFDFRLFPNWQLPGSCALLSKKSSRKCFIQRTKTWTHQLKRLPNVTCGYIVPLNLSNSSACYQINR